MPSDSVLLVEPATIPLPASPSFAVNNHPVSTDSMVSIRLSQPPPSAPAPLDDDDSTSASESAESDATTESDATIEPPTYKNNRRSSVRIVTPVDLDTEINGSRDEEEEAEDEDEEEEDEDNDHEDDVVEVEEVDQELDTDVLEPDLIVASPDDELLPEDDHPVETTLEAAPLSGSMPPTPFDDADGEPLGESDLHRRDSTTSSTSHSSSDSEQVDWAELDKDEEAAPQDQVSDEQTAFLLARLEQENNALATNPRVANLKRDSTSSKPTKAPRPPSIQVLKKLVQEPSSSGGAESRLSQLPTPPPMTELEFWAALVKDYPQTAQRLPTLTANKIKGGVPPPLRGVVWVSMVGARDPHLSDEFDRLADEESPYETMIGKDIGRSFPGVEMFKEAGGEGQLALGKVLKVFSLYDEEIGYCQGLGFLVGPLLMQMGEKDAFCVLVKLMEKYDLRSCFMPDLHGLHLRIYQFQSLLDTHMPELAKHFASLSVEAAYLSQWFLSFFAVTCPLPMLFRIYDVIFAEGASETIMRVAMSLMKQNEKKLMGITEFEEVMQLLLGRLLWEPYEGSADDLVNDFVGLTGIVTHESLQKLEKAFKDAKKVGVEPAPRPGFFQDVSMGASRFLGRLWTSHGPSKSTASLVPPNNAEGKTRHLRSSPSKQSIAASENSTHGSSESTSNSSSTTATDATVITRNSSADVMAIAAAAKEAAANKDRDLNGQIEDLLTALGEMQREQAILNGQMEKQNEERDEDHRVLRELIGHVQAISQERSKPKTKVTSKEDRRKTTPALPFYSFPPENAQGEAAEELSEDPAVFLDDVLVDRAEARLKAHRDNRGSVVLDTKKRLRKSLLRSKDQLNVEITRATELEHRIHVQTREIDSLRDQLSHARNRIQEDFTERRKLEIKLEKQQMAAQKRNSIASTSSETGSPSIWRSESWGSKRASLLLGSGNSSPTTPTSGSGGLRELQLGKSLNNSDTGSGKTTSTSSKPSSPLKSSGTLKSPGGSTSIPARGSSLATRSVLATEDHRPANEDAMLVELVAAKTAEAVAKQELEEVKGRMDALRKMLTLPGAPSPNGAELDKVMTHKTGLSQNAVPQTGAGSSETPKKDSKAKENLATPSATPAASSWFSWSRRTASTNTVLQSVPEKK